MAGGVLRGIPLELLLTWQVNMIKLYSVSEIADRLGVTPSLVRRWCRTGRFGVKVGGRWIVTESGLERFAESRRKPGRPQMAKGED